MISFRESLWNKRQKGLYTDYTITIDNRNYYCHKIVVFSNPGYFQSFFQFNFKESTEDSITLKIPDPYESFYHILEYMYLGKISKKLDPNQLISTIFLAQYFQFNELYNSLCSELGNMDNATFSSFSLTTLFEIPLLNWPDSLIHQLSSSFSTLYVDPTFLLLDPCKVHLILNDSHLKIQNEIQLVKFLNSYIQAHDLDSNDFKAISKCIRWELIPIEGWRDPDVDSFSSILFPPQKKNTYISIYSSKILPGMQHPLVVIALSYHSPQKTIQNLSRYNPPLITCFGNNILSSPQSFGLTIQREKILKKPGLGIQLGFRHDKPGVIFSMKFEFNQPLCTGIHVLMNAPNFQDEPYQVGEGIGKNVELNICPKMPYDNYSISFNFNGPKLEIVNFSIEGFIVN